MTDAPVISAVKHAIVVETFNEVRRNTLRGFAKIVLPSGMILIDVAIHVQADAAWAMPPSKAMLDRNGDTMRDGPKVRYAPVIAFRSKELRDRFSAQVIEALRQSHPEALS
jgi:hypothetical protein